MKRIGLAETMFAQVNMGKIARTHLEDNSPSDLEIISVTVPGFKDLAVASKKLIEEQKCDIVLAMGWRAMQNWMVGQRRSHLRV